MMEAGWSARRVACQLGCFDCVVWRRWDHWIREMSFTQTECSRRPQQNSHREDRHIVTNASAQPTPSLAAIQAQVVHSLGAPVARGTTFSGTLHYSTYLPIFSGWKLKTCNGPYSTNIFKILDIYGKI
ncbi:uncharacterized protein TNCV_4061771 [Trichonephila clavipes]|nr:uncharacterized protein TNCV_4061771 [Trichonephila clavipes]